MKLRSGRERINVVPERKKKRPKSDSEEETKRPRYSDSDSSYEESSSGIE